MDRRAFIGTLTGGLLAAPLAAKGQQTGRSHRIGILGNVPPTEPYGALLWGAFEQLQLLADDLRAHDACEAVMFPPGRARLATSPLPIGSPIMTISSAWPAGLPRRSDRPGPQ